MLVLPDGIIDHIHVGSIYRRTMWQIRQPMAEFFGTMILVIFGAGAGASVTLSGNPGVAPTSKGDFLSINFGWAVGLAIGVWISGGVSGGHINPARVYEANTRPAYIVAQVLGGLVGAALIYGIYVPAIDIFEGHAVRTKATASIFATYPLDYVPAAAAFFTEFIATMIFAMTVLAATDKKSAIAPPTGLLPLTLFILFIGFGTSLGMQTSWALNPARDFGPRLFLSMAGYGRDVYNFRRQYWIWCPIMAPILGAQTGAFFYDFFLYTGQGILNPNGPY
ncbi:aquaporin-like protein [Ephemerocybe angulata]|uniref:Aquaporin-like protein n=1 Tax=Ephemerocybe angulata TaxID=980116 RepID=A0A8H6H8I3_9AGAR|nr:aquaporin-like protein [Tulosesus angulatus]